MSNDTGLIMKYFVLKPRGTNVYAGASRHAMAAYSDYLTDNEGDEELARQLMDWSTVELIKAERAQPGQAKAE